jgi:hypothetical protein
MKTGIAGTRIAIGTITITTAINSLQDDHRGALL